MKLLPKKEVAAIKLKEKELEIQEGMKLAKKIDLIRETLAKEEVNLIKFRDDNINRVLQEVKELLEKKALLVEEVSVLEEKRKNALMPITKEIKELELLKAQVEEKEKFIRKFNQSLT